MDLLKRRIDASRVLRRGGRRGERGMAYVETLLVLPVVLLLILGLADFSFVFKHYLVAGNAASEAARTATLFRSPCSGADASAAANDAENNARGLLLAGGVQPAQIVDIDVHHFEEGMGANLCSRGMVEARVEVRNELTFLSGLFPFSFLPFNVTATATAQNENQN